MIGIIWYDYKQNGIQQFERIIKNYDALKIEPIRLILNNYECHAQFANGDIWKIAPATDHSRGQKCNISYIDSRIQSESISNIIRPATILRPFQAYQYY